MAKTYDDRWEIVKPLGEGGQAQTFLVRDTRGSGVDLYALKRLRDLNRLDRFKREIETIRNLTHENVLRLVDFNLDGPTPYLVSEYCTGGSLPNAQPFWKDSAISALVVFQQICQGVSYAHSQGVIHRDLKPDNIFLRSSDGPAVVGDFGICYLEDTTRLTSTDRAIGPRLFMAPELEDGRDETISNKADTYSLGKVLYWLLSGGRIFSREKHRERNWDLKGANADSPLGWNNIYLEHVNRLLDLMILNNTEERSSVSDVCALLPHVIRRVEKQFNPVSLHIIQPCTYCGEGRYELQAQTITQVRNFGLEAVGDPKWRIFTCESCGHVQMFRIDLTEKNTLWI